MVRYDHKLTKKSLFSTLKQIEDQQLAQNGQNARSGPWWPTIPKVLDILFSQNRIPWVKKQLP